MMHMPTGCCKRKICRQNIPSSKTPLVIYIYRVSFPRANGAQHCVHLLDLLLCLQALARAHTSACLHTSQAPLATRAAAWHRCIPLEVCPESNAQATAEETQSSAAAAAQALSSFLMASDLFFRSTAALYRSKSVWLDFISLFASFFPQALSANFLKTSAWPPLCISAALPPCDTKSLKIVS